MPPSLRRIAFLLALSPVSALAQLPVPVPQLQPPLQTTTPADYRAHVETLQSLVSACRANPQACDAAAVGDDNKVEAPGGTYQVRWQWLRKLIGDAHTTTLPNRATLLDQAFARLGEELAATGADTQPQPEFAPARRLANSILATPEFRIVNNQSWFDRQIAKLESWFLRIFTAAADLGRRDPWLSTFLEWAFVGLTLAAVLFWVRRTMQRQQLAIALGGSAPASDWQQKSAEWAELAQSEANLGNWREAIHCLYWAAIISLERRRLWSRNYARTPREYLPLLEPGSPNQIALRTLTGLFERIWYGLRGAAQEDYLHALALFEDLKRA
jgi:Domain of unknown function (DUF4129)